MRSEHIGHQGLKGKKLRVCGIGMYLNRLNEEGYGQDRDLHTYYKLIYGKDDTVEQCERLVKNGTKSIG